MPTNNYNNLNNCDGGAWSPAFTQWVSAATDPLVMNITVPWGTSSVPLRLNWNGATCRYSPNSVVRSRLLVTSASPSGVGGIVNEQSELGFGAGTPVGFYTDTTNGFTFAPPGGFTATSDYIITLNNKSINEFPGNVFGCVTSGPAVSTTAIDNFAPCPTTSPRFLIKVTVLPQPPQGAVDSADCTAVVGWAVQPNAPTRSIAVDMYITNHNHNDYVGIARYPTNVFRQDVNDYFNSIGIPVTGNHGFRIPIPPAYKNANDYTVRIYAIGVNAAGVRTNINPLIGTKTFGPCVSPGRFEIEHSYTIELNDVEEPTSARFDITTQTDKFPVNNVGVVAFYSINRAATPLDYPELAPPFGWTETYTTAATKPHLRTIALPASLNLKAGDGVCLLYVVNPQKGLVDALGNTSGTASYTSDWQCERVVNRPYVRVYGNDVFTGVSEGCEGWPATDIVSDPTEPDGGIYGIGRNLSDGSANQLALLAFGKIAGFRSAVLRTSSPGPTKGLHFSNNLGEDWASTADSPGGLLAGVGGNGMYHCPNNFYGAADTGTNVTGLTFNPSIAAYSSGGNYKMTDVGTKTVPGGAAGITIPPGRRITVYIDGNVHINQNITYNSTSPWVDNGSMTNMPSFTLVASGNIYIDKAVTRLDGSYIAQNADPAKDSTIYTCTNGPLLYTDPATQLFAACNKQLTVNGALVATRIKWLRTFGSLRNSKDTGEWPGNTNTATNSNNCSSAVPAQSTVGVCASEVVNYNAQVYLAPPPPGTPSNRSSTYEYFTILPPLL